MSQQKELGRQCSFQLYLCRWINQVNVNLNFHKANESDLAKCGTIAFLSAAVSWDVTTLF